MNRSSCGTLHPLRFFNQPARQKTFALLSRVIQRAPYKVQGNKRRFLQLLSSCLSGTTCDPTGHAVLNAVQDKRKNTSPLSSGDIKQTYAFDSAKTRL